MNPHFPGKVREAIRDGHPLATELYEAWLDLTWCERTAEYLTVRQLWDHANRREREQAS